MQHHILSDIHRLQHPSRTRPRSKGCGSILRSPWAEKPPDTMGVDQFRDPARPKSLSDKMGEESFLGVSPSVSYNRTLSTWSPNYPDNLQINWVWSPLIDGGILECKPSLFYPRGWCIMSGMQLNTSSQLAGGARPGVAPSRSAHFVSDSGCKGAYTAGVSGLIPSAFSSC